MRRSRIAPFAIGDAMNDADSTVAATSAPILGRVCLTNRVAKWIFASCRTDVEVKLTGRHGRNYIKNDISGAVAAPSLKHGGRVLQGVFVRKLRRGGTVSMLSSLGACSAGGVSAGASTTITAPFMVWGWMMQVYA